MIDCLLLPEQSSLRRALVLWIKQTVQPDEWSDSETQQHWKQLDKLEVKDMLAEHVKRWSGKWIQKGIEQGLERSSGQEHLQIVQKMLRHTPLTDAQIADTGGMDKAAVCALRQTINESPSVRNRSTS